MLAEFENEGKARGYFIYAQIKDLPQSQCKKSTIEVCVLCFATSE